MFIGFTTLAWLAKEKVWYLIIALTLIAAWVATKWRWKIIDDEPDEFTQPQAGDARFCSLEEFEQTNNPDGNYNSGIWIGGGFTRSKFFNAIVIGSAGCGKTTGHVMPNLLLKPQGSYLINDVKGEICFTTAKAQAEYGQTVYILDFWGVQESLGARHGIKPCGFNPFDFIKHDPEHLIDNCNSIAYFLCPNKPSDKDTYWVERSRSLIKSILLHILTGMKESDHNFWSLYKALRYGPDEFANFLLTMKKNPALDGLISVAAEEWLGMQEAETTMMGIRSNAQAATAIFESPALRNFMQRSDFNPYNLSNGTSTVYIVIPERFLDTHANLLRLIVGLCLKAVNTKPANPVYFFIDEAPLLKKMADIPKNFAFGRGQNIHMILYAQSLSALREQYGEDGMNSLIANSAVLQLYGGARDWMTTSYFSKVLGQKTVVKKSDSYGSSHSKEGCSNSTNTSYNTEKQPLITPEQIGNIDGVITIADGKKIIIKNTPYFKNRYENVDIKEVWLDEEERALIKKGIMPRDENYELFMQKAHQPLRY